MPALRVDRRLAAILAADVVGYSCLIERDEAGTLARLKALRKEVIEPILADHNGRIVKLMGDGALVEFPSASEAVAAAVDMQRAVADHERDWPPSERIHFRIGINLGDIVHEDGDIFGEGVNLAARVQALAEPGGIWITRNVYEQARYRLPLSFAALGQHRVKNIAEPVAIYRVASNAKVGRLRRFAPLRGRRGRQMLTVALALLLGLFLVGGTWWFWPHRPSLRELSIAVLAFENLSGDPDQGYLADGFAEDLITEFARNKELAVVARNTSFSFKGQGKTAEQIARELGVRYVLEGSVRRTGDYLRLSAQLIDGARGRHVWADRYDIRASEIVGTQDAIVRRVAGMLFSEMRETEKAASLRRSPESLDVYGLAVYGLAMKHQFSGIASRDGRAALKRAIALAPDYAAAHAYLGYLDAVDIAGSYSGEKGPEHIDEAIASIHRAIELDPSMAYAYQALGVALEMKGLPEEALRAMERAVELGPSDADNQLLYGRGLATNGRFAEAVAAGERAVALNPVSPIFYYANHARALYGAGRYEDSVKLTQACIDRRSYHRVCRAVRIASLVELGRLEEARAEMRNFLAHAPSFSERAAATYAGYAGDRGATERLFSRLRQAGLAGQASE